MRVSCLILFVLLLSGCNEPTNSPSSNGVSASGDATGLVSESTGPTFKPLEDILESYLTIKPTWTVERAPEGDRQYRLAAVPCMANHGTPWNGQIEFPRNGEWIKPNYPGIPGHELLVLRLNGDDGYVGYAVLTRKVDLSSDVASGP